MHASKAGYLIHDIVYLKTVVLEAMRLLCTNFYKSVHNYRLVHVHVHVLALSRTVFSLGIFPRGCSALALWLMPWKPNVSFG